MSKTIKVVLFILSLSLVSLSCRLTSPTPASWIGTPTAESRAATNAAILLTQEAAAANGLDLIPSPSPTATISTSTPTPEVAADGPWLVYPAPDGSGVHAYDIDARKIIAISLPTPITFTDLARGFSPDSNQIILRAGSPLNFDELALYQIELPSTDPVQISPLLSLELQREIVNQVGSRAFETLQAVTLEDGITWSPSGRYLAFTAGLDNDSSDLYIFDTFNNDIQRLNGLYTQNASPFWAPASNWLISQELGSYEEERGWRAENVTGLEVPGFDNLKSLYVPDPDSRKEVFVGWTNPQSFITYSETAEGFKMLQQVNVDKFKKTIILDGFFNQAAFDPETKALAVSINHEFASLQEMTAGIYLLKPESPFLTLAQAGDWDRLYWDSGGQFVTSGPQGVFIFDIQGDNILLPGEENALLSPDGNWLLAWNDSGGSEDGLRLYQSDNDRPLQTISQDPIKSVIWASDSKTFFVQSEGVLYHLAFPGLSLEKIEDGFSKEVPMIWTWVE